MAGEPTHAASKQWYHPPQLRISIIAWKENDLVPATYAVQISNCLKRTCGHYENYGQFPLSITCPPQNWHFLWWAKINGTQRWALVKYMKNELYVQQYGKMHLSDWRNVKEQAHSLSHCLVMRIWRYRAGRYLVSQSVSHSVENYIK